MQEHERIARQVFERSVDNIARPREQRRRVSYPPFRLKAARP